MCASLRPDNTFSRIVMAGNGFGFWNTMPIFKRIAAGSGTTVQDVNRLVKQYQDMARMMKKMGGKTGAAAMKAMLGGSGMPGGGGAMLDLGALSRGLGSSGFGKGLGGGLAKGLGSSLANGLPGLGGKPDGKKK